MLTVLPIWLCLLAAHLLGEFVLQPAALARAKRRWSPWALLAHAALHALLGYALLGVTRAWPSFVLLGLLHNFADIATQTAETIARRGSRRFLRPRVGLAVAASSRLARLGFLGVIVWVLTDGQGVEPDDMAWLHVAPGGYLQMLVLITGAVLVGPAGARLADCVVPAVSSSNASQADPPASGQGPDRPTPEPSGGGECLDRSGWLGVDTLRRAVVFVAAIAPGGALAGAIAFVGIVWLTRSGDRPGQVARRAEAGDVPAGCAPPETTGEPDASIGVNQSPHPAAPIEVRLLVDAAWALSAGLLASAALGRL
jgi:hypothetical protein